MMENAGLLGSRGARATVASLSYLDLMLSVSGRSGRKYDKDRNPDGVINLAVAENRLSFDGDLRERLGQAHQVVAKSSLYSADSEDVENHFSPFYSDMKGNAEFRRNICEYLSRVMLKDLPEGAQDFKFETRNLVVSAGCGALVDILAWALCEVGDGCIIPAPYYPAFDNDLNVRAGVNAIPAQMEYDEQTRTWSLTEACLNEAYAQSMKSGHRPKMILLTSPQNPLGINHTEAELRMVLRWARAHGMIIISDEVYAKSHHGISDEDAPYTSFCKIALEASNGKYLGDDVQILYGMSKDFGLSGFRIGVLYSENPHLQRSLHNLAYFSCVSVDTQAILNDLIQDLPWVDGYLERNGQRLQDSCKVVTDALESCGIPFTKPTSAIFLLMDLSALLKDKSSWESERELFYSLVNDTGVFFTPGHDCHAPRPGFFRCCYGNVDIEALKVAMNRLVKRYQEHA